jgi:shikimate 5-dehydrogenase
MKDGIGFSSTSRPGKRSGSHRARDDFVIDGLGTLLHQARPGCRAWLGIAPEVSETARATVLGGLG